MTECFACWRETVCEHQLPPGEMHAGKPICAVCKEELDHYRIVRYIKATGGRKVTGFEWQSKEKGN